MMRGCGTLDSFVTPSRVRFDQQQGTLVLNEAWGEAVLESDPLRARSRLGRGAWRPCIPYLDIPNALVAFDPGGGPIAAKSVPEPDPWHAARDLASPQFTFEFDAGHTPGQAVRRWLALLPAPAVRAAGRYCPGPWTWNMLRAFRLIPVLVELSEANPALAYAAGSRALYRGPDRGWKEVKAQFAPGRSQTDLLAYLGFEPATRLVRKILSKIPITDISAGLLGELRKALAAAARRDADFPRKFLSHLPILTRRVVEMLDPRYAGMISPGLLLDAAARVRGQGNPPVVVLDEVLRLRKFLRGGNGVPARFHTLRRLETEAASLRERVDFEDSVRAKPIPLSSRFGPPPLAGEPRLTPIRTARDLRTLALSLRNCLWNNLAYPLSALHGRMFVYALNLAGERGAVVLSRDDFDEWTIESAGVNNRALSRDAEVFIRDWARPLGVDGVMFEEMLT